MSLEPTKLGVSDISSRPPEQRSDLKTLAKNKHDSCLPSLDFNRAGRAISEAGENLSTALKRFMVGDIESKGRGPRAVAIAGSLIAIPLGIIASPFVGIGYLIGRPLKELLTHGDTKSMVPKALIGGLGAFGISFAYGFVALGFNISALVKSVAKEEKVIDLTALELVLTKEGSEYPQKTIEKNSFEDVAAANLQNGECCFIKAKDEKGELIPFTFILCAKRGRKVHQLPVKLIGGQIYAPINVETNEIKNRGGHPGVEEKSYAITDYLIRLIDDKGKPFTVFRSACSPKST